MRHVVLGSFQSFIMETMSLSKFSTLMTVQKLMSEFASDHVLHCAPLIWIAQSLIQIPAQKMFSTMDLVKMSKLLRFVLIVQKDSIQSLSMFELMIICWELINK